MSDNSVMRLSQSVVKSAPLKTKRYEIWDSTIKGFGLRIAPSGVKTFIVRYRSDSGGRSAARRYITIGRYGTVTVEEARTKAKQLLAQVSLGGDPVEEARRADANLSVAQLVDLYEREGCNHMKAMTRRYTIARLRNHIIPLLGTTKVRDLRPAQISKMISQIAEGKTQNRIRTKARGHSIVKGGKGAAAKAVRDLSAMLNFAVTQEITDTNVCNRIKKPSDGQRDRYLDKDELKRLVDVVEQLTAEGGNEKIELIVKLWILTGCRNNEIVGLKWSEVDLSNCRLVLSDTKTGRSIRPISTEAASILKGIVPHPTSPFVFPAERGEGHYLGVKNCWPTIIHRANLPGVTPHTLRHTLGSIAASAGESLLMVGGLLGHANPRSTAIYAHLQPASLSMSANRVGKLLSFNSEADYENGRHSKEN